MTNRSKQFEVSYEWYWGGRLNYRMRNIKFNMSFYTKDDRGSSCPWGYRLSSGVGNCGRGFSVRKVGRPWAGEDRTVDGVDLLWRSGRGCHQHHHRFHRSPAVRGIIPGLDASSQERLQAVFGVDTGEAPPGGRGIRQLGEHCCLENWLSAFLVHAMWAQDFQGVEGLPGWNLCMKLNFFK